MNLTAQKHQPNKTEVWVKRRSIHIGMFDSKIEAAKARDKYVKLIFGEFANLNGI